MEEATASDRNDLGRADLPPFNHYLVCAMERHAGAHIHRVNNLITGYYLLWETTAAEPTESAVAALLDFEARLQTCFAALVLHGRLPAAMTEVPRDPPHGL